jgi:hypothetical protein
MIFHAAKAIGRRTTLTETGAGVCFSAAGLAGNFLREADTAVVTLKAGRRYWACTRPGPAGVRRRSLGGRRSRRDGRGVDPPQVDPGRRAWGSGRISGTWVPRLRASGSGTTAEAPERLPASLVELRGYGIEIDRHVMVKLGVAND